MREHDHGMATHGGEPAEIIEVRHPSDPRLGCRHRGGRKTTHVPMGLRWLNPGASRGPVTAAEFCPRALSVRQRWTARSGIRAIKPAAQ